jgi:NADH:ubiquinone oxidoreductase subunit H
VTPVSGISAIKFHLSIVLILTGVKSKNLFALVAALRENIKSLMIEMAFNSSDYRFSTYISDIGYFRTLSLEEDQHGISQIAMFSHPTLGEIVYNNIVLNP